jgi:hypothetical protein
MKITELLVESQQLDEGPFTQAIGKVGGKIAKGAAAIGKDLKTGFKAGYSGEEPAADPNTPAATTAPAAAATPTTQAAPVKKQAAPAKVTATSAPSAPAAEPTATTAEPAPAEEPAAKPAATADGKDATAVKKELDDFLATYRKDLAMQNKNWEFVTPKVNALEKQVADLVAAGSATATAPATEPAVTPAAEPAPKARGGKVAGELSQSPSAVRRREQRARGKAAPTQAEIDADRERNIGMTSDSVIRTSASLSETLARKVQEQKQRMFETALMSGTQSVFKK